MKSRSGCSCRSGWRAGRQEYNKRRMQSIDPQAVFTSRNVQRRQEDVHAKKTHLLTTSFLLGKPQPFHIHYRCSVLYKELSRPVRRKEMGTFFRERSGTTPDGMHNLSFWRLMASHRIKHNDCAVAHSSGFLVKHPNIKDHKAWSWKFEVMNILLTSVPAGNKQKGCWWWWRGGMRCGWQKSWP